MGVFDFFRKKTIQSTDNGIPGPTFFDGLTEHIAYPPGLRSKEWRRKIRSDSGQTQFRIEFYGQTDERYPALITGTDFAPSLIYAVDIITGDKILLFDGCKHGYNAMFCDTFSEEQIKERPVDKIYGDRDGNELFEIIVSVYNGMEDDELPGNGVVELINGSSISVEAARRNAFDTILIIVVNQNGVVTLVSEELA